MGYEIMKLVCCFDLPTETNQQKRMYRNFRKMLLSSGFQMLQYSVYVRTCPNRSYSKKFYSKLQLAAPSEGNIRLFTITEKQYDDMVLIVGHKSKQEIKIADNRLVCI